MRSILLVIEASEIPWIIRLVANEITGVESVGYYSTGIILILYYFNNCIFRIFEKLRVGGIISVRGGMKGGSTLWQIGA